MYTDQQLEAAISMRNTMRERIYQTPWKAIAAVFGPNIQMAVDAYVKGHYADKEVKDV